MNIATTIRRLEAQLALKDECTGGLIFLQNAAGRGFGTYRGERFPTIEAWRDANPDLFREHSRRCAVVVEHSTPDGDVRWRNAKIPREGKAEVGPLQKTLWANQ